MSQHVPERGEVHAALPSDCQQETLVVAFFDLSRIGEWSSSEEDERVACFFQQFYEQAAQFIEPHGGRIVKFLGDAGLAVFPKENAEKAIFALCEFADEARSKAADFGFDTYLNVNIHVGPVFAGTFGPASHQRFDIIGKTVNITARLGRRGVTLSAQAFRCLSEDGRKRFKKNAPPVTYRFR